VNEHHTATTVSGQDTPQTDGDQSVSTVLFDLDDTLCSYHRSGGELIQLAFEEHGIEPFFDVIEYYRRYPEFVDHTETVEQLRRECFAAIATDCGYEQQTGYRLADTFAANRDHSAVTALPGAITALERLGEQYHIGLVTNGAPGMQAQKLDSLGIRDAFEILVHAGYDTPAKPDPAAFDHALAHFDAVPEQAVHIGNSLGSDVAGAQSAGLGAVWLPDGTHQGAPDPMPDYTLDSLHDLLEPPWIA